MKKMDKRYCIGCRDNFYNQEGNSTTGECWSLKSAMIIRRKKVSISQVPPWNQSAGKYPSCMRCEGYIFVEPNAKY
jgi:hypothetical protein